MICRTGHISYTDEKEFADNTTEAIKRFQEQGLTVEIQYHPVVVGNLIIYTAFVIGRKADERN